MKFMTLSDILNIFWHSILWDDIIDPQEKKIVKNMKKESKVK